MLYRWILACFLLVLIGTGKAQNAPITSIADYSNQLPGEIFVPVTVTGFNSIGAGSLTLEYDPSAMTFIEGIKNPALTGFFAIGDNPAPSGMRRIVIGWFGNALNLPDGSTLVNLKFNFLGGTTNLTWFDDGSSCEYTDAEFNSLNDSPTALYYKNGIVTDNKCLNLEFYLEGLYDPTAHRMNSAVGSIPGPGFDGVADSVQVEIHQASPYSTVLFTSGKIELSMQGHARVLVPPSLNDSYYITVKHRNSITTVSSIPVSFSGAEISYNFTDMASKAYLSNMIQMTDGKWAFYAGDVNQDGAVDTADLSPVDNDASIFASGYINTDVNGDGIVDTGDMTIVDNNSANFVSAANP